MNNTTELSDIDSEPSHKLHLTSNECNRQPRTSDGSKVTSQPENDQPEPAPLTAGGAYIGVYVCDPSAALVTSTAHCGSNSGCMRGPRFDQTCPGSNYVGALGQVGSLIASASEHALNALASLTGFGTR